MIAASKQLDEQYDIQGQAKKAGAKTGQALEQGTTIVLMKASELDGTYKITDKTKAKWQELNEKHKIAEKAGKAVQMGQQLLGTGVAALQAKMAGEQSSAGASAGASATDVDSKAAPKK